MENARLARIEEKIGSASDEYCFSFFEADKTPSEDGGNCPITDAPRVLLSCLECRSRKSIVMIFNDVET